MGKMFKKVLLFLGLVFVGLFVQTNVFGLSEAEGKNQSAKISVILPVYNVEKYLDESLKTVENQTYKNLEIICVNDGSPDNCGKILEEHARRDKRIKIITQKNQGLSEARNVGLRASTADYVFFCDPDDFIVPHVLEKSMNLFNKYKNLDAVEFGLTRVPFGKKVDLNSYKYDESKIRLLECKGKQNPWKIFRSNGWSVCKYVYRKSFFTDNNLEFKKGLRIHEDILFGFIAMPHMKRVVRDKNIGYIYRINRPGSITTSDCKIAKKKLEGFIEIINEIIANHDRFKYFDADEYVLHFMIYIVYNKVKNIGTPEDVQHYAKIVYDNIWNKFVKKYKVKLKGKNAKRLEQLKLWAGGSEKEKISGSGRNAVKRKNKKF